MPKFIIPDLKNIVYKKLYFYPPDLSETIHLSKCRSAISEDDTIMEESMYSNGVQKEKSVTSQHQKVATILRSRSCRDREILCK